MFAAAIIAVAVPVLYVLSVAPMLWLAAHGYLPVAVAHVYQPLWWTGSRIKALGAFVEWWIMRMPS